MINQFTVHFLVFTLFYQLKYEHIYLDFIPHSYRHTKHIYIIMHYQISYQYYYLLT